MADSQTHLPDGRPRGRGLGLPFPGEPGPDNAITDVAGVAVGYTTLIEGAGALRPGKGPVRTGVTAILPRTPWRPDASVCAGVFTLNGNGEMTGTHWINESGCSSLRADPRTCDSSTRGWRCQTPEHDADHGETDEGDNGSGITLEVAGEAPVAADPGERSLHDPAFRQGHEAVRVGALNDFQLPAAGRGDGRRHPRPLVAAVGEDGLDEGERTARGSKQLAGAVAILHVGGMDDDAQQQAECIDEDVALAPRDLLARIEALRVERSPPFCAPLALWLSITAADGLASRPSRSRTAT